MSALIGGSWDEARAIAATSFAILSIESIEVSQGVDRTIATDVHALCDLPTYATSAMDGYAVGGQGPWRIVGEIKAGLPMKGALAEGTAVGIATGAVIPVGTFGVIRWELAQVHEQARERRDDVPLLARRFLARSAELSGIPNRELSTDAVTSGTDWMRPQV